MQGDGLSDGVESRKLSSRPNSAEEVGCTGPALPEGDEARRCEFRLYALSAESGLELGATEGELVAAMKAKIVQQSTLSGMYSR